MKYISIDCGKYNTKLSAFDEATGKIANRKVRTKTSKGTFIDDMLERGTFITQVDDGEVYKIGADAENEPDLETSKKSEIHRICTLTAIAMALGPGEHEDICVAIGIPLQLSKIPEERIEYKDYILGPEGGKHTVKLKTSSTGPVIESAYTIKERYVYPEGNGVVYEYPVTLGGQVGIIDIGNLNINNVYVDHYRPVRASSFTDELGGKVLISGLAQELTSELGSRVNDNMTASVLLQPYESRYLTPANGNRDIEERSRDIIDNYLLEHVRAIKRKCDSRHWPLDFMQVVCIGGTTKLLTKELAEVFGDNVMIPPNPEYINANGFLRKMCADHDIDIGNHQDVG